MSRKRAAVLVVAVAVVLGVSVAFSALRTISLGAGDAADVPTYTVARGDFVRQILAEGNLEAAQATSLTVPGGGRRPLKIAWLAQDGIHVEEGEVVVRFDPTELEGKLRDGLSERATAESRIGAKRATENGVLRNLERNAAQAQLDLDYAHEFQTKDPEIFNRIEIIESEIDQALATQRKDNAHYLRDIREELAEVEVELLGIQLKQADLQIAEAEKDLQELEIRAPHEGIFVLKESWGGVPTVGQVVWRHNTVAEIPRLDEMEAKVFVLEADAGGLQDGLSAMLRLEAHPGRLYHATVKKVDALAKRRNRRVPVQYFAVTLELEQTDPELMKPGQRVAATLELGREEGVLTVPRQAVFREDDGSIVYLRRGGEFRPQQVELGPAGLGRVVVTSGLDEGDVVALRDPTRPLREPQAEEAAGPGGMSGGAGS